MTTVEPKYITVTAEELEEAGTFAVEGIIARTTRPLDFGRWTITNIGINIPRNPIAAFAQIKWPKNGDLTVSDNFSSIVTTATTSLIRVNTWRTDSGADPSENFSLGIVVFF